MRQPTVHASALLEWCALPSTRIPCPRALVIVAHPDDETIGAGALLGRLNGCVVAHLTDGAPRDLAFARQAGFATREMYARERRRELERAMTLAGVARHQLRSLGAIDQEALLELPGLTRKVVALMEEVRPELVLTLPYEGGHPDHDAAAFVVEASIRLIQRRGDTPPVVIEMALYHQTGEQMETFRFLEPSGRVVASVLDEKDRTRKRKMISSFRSQQEVLRPFAVERELFRLASPYDFRVAPHAGLLHYERQGWGITGEAFRSQARRAVERLGLT